MDRFRSNLSFKCIKLDDARTIVQHSFIVHNAVTPLDLSTCEYTSYRRQFRATSDCSKSFFRTEEDSRRFFTKQRDILYTYHLDLPRGLEPRLREELSFRIEEAEGDGESFYVRKIHVSNSWYKTVVRGFLAPFVRQTDRKMKDLRKLMLSFLTRGEYSYRVSQEFSYVIVSNILYCESYESGNVNGILIEVNSCDQFAIANEADALFYETYGKVNTLQNTPVFDLMTFNLLGKSMFNILPTLFLHGHMPRYDDVLFNCMAEFMWDYQGYTAGHLRKGINEGRWSVRRNCQVNLTLFTFFLCMYRRAARQPAPHVFRMMWRAIPDSFLSRAEVEYAYKDVIEEDVFNRFNVACEKALEEYPQHPTPRSLKHYSRIIIRTCLKESGFLPKGISSLGMPKKMQSYLKLEL